MNKSRMNIQRKLVGFLLFSSLVPLAALGCVGIFQLDRNLRDMAKFKIEGTLTLNQFAVRKMLDMAQDSLLEISEISPVAHLGSLPEGQRIEKPLEEAEKALIASYSLYAAGKCSYFSQISFADREGNELLRLHYHEKERWRKEKGKDMLGGEPLFIRGRSLDGRSPQVAVATKFQDRPGIFLLAPLRSPDRRFQGALIATLSKEYIDYSFAIKKRGEMRHGFTENVLLLTQDGSVLYSTVGLSRERPTVYNAIPRAIADEVLADYTGKIYQYKKDDECVLVYDSIAFRNPAERKAPKPGNSDHLLIAISSPSPEFYENMRYYRHLLQYLLGAFTIVSIVTGLYLSRIFLKPIRELIRGTEEISRGNLDYALTLKTNDEFEDLAHHFNDMVGRLREIYGKIEQKVQERTLELAQANRLIEQARESMALEKERLEAVLDSTKEGILMCDPAGDLVFFNRSCDEMFALSAAGDGRQGNVRDLISRREAFQAPDLCIADIEGLLSNPGETRSGQIVKTVPHLQIIDWFSAPVRKEEIIGRVMAFRDVTRDKEVERMKDEFVSIVSHELRTPMTAIFGSLSLVADGTVGDVNEDQLDLLVTAKDNTTRLIRLINDILDISKIESGKMKMDYQELDMPSVVKTSLEGIRGFAAQYGVTVTSDMAAEISPLIADRDRIIQVITNLLSNAIKFSPRGGIVHCALRQEQEMVRFSVKDEGIGIPDEYLGKIFEKFQQVDSSAVREKGGTGLGLPICKALIEEHGGTMWVESEQGKGSTFFFSIPIRHAGKDS